MATDQKRFFKSMNFPPKLFLPCIFHHLYNKFEMLKCCYSFCECLKNRSPHCLLKRIQLWQTNLSNWKKPCKLTIWPILHHMILILSNYLEPPLLNNELNSKSSNILNYVYVLNQFHFEGTVVQMIITSYLISENISCLKKMKRNSTWQ